MIRFRNPDEGEVVLDDMVKGTIIVDNGELDDLVLLRADGVPTYNFGVVVDDLDMGITHVIRGDDHVNNTPRQINIFRALGATLPKFAHVPMILGADGEKLSKRHGAVSVMQYRDDGYLPEALVNYLARLGWSHGDEEVFSREQLVEWFDLDHISKSAAQFDPQKLQWLNAQYIKQADDPRLAGLVRPFLLSDGANPDRGPALERVVGLLKERVSTIEELADAAVYFYRALEPTAELRAQHYTPEAIAALSSACNPLGDRRVDAPGHRRRSEGDRGRAQAEDAEDRHAPAGHGHGRDPDAVHRRHPGVDRPGRKPFEDAAGAGPGGWQVAPVGQFPLSPRGRGQGRGGPSPDLQRLRQ